MLAYGIWEYVIYFLDYYDTIAFICSSKRIAKRLASRISVWSCIFQSIALEKVYLAQRIDIKKVAKENVAIIGLIDKHVCQEYEVGRNLDACLVKTTR